MLGITRFIWWMDAGQTTGTTAWIDRHNGRNSNEEFLYLGKLLGTDVHGKKKFCSMQVETEKSFLFLKSASFFTKTKMLGILPDFLKRNF